MPKLDTWLNWTPNFEKYVIRYGSKHEYQTDMYLKEIGLCAQITKTITDLIVNMMGSLG